MYSVSISIFVIAMLAVMAGITLALGVRREQRGQGVMFCMAAVFGAIWASAISVFLILPDTARGNAIAPSVVLTIYSSAIFMMIFMMAFLTSRMRLGRVAIIVFLMYGVALLTLLWSDPSLLYHSITLGGEQGYNSVGLVNGWYYAAYSCFLVAIASITLGLTLYRIIRSEVRNERAGLTVMMGGFFIAMIFCVIFDIWLPPTRYDLIWLGPVSICAIVCAYFYAALKFHTIVLSSKGMRFLSYLIIVFFVAAIYIFVYSMATKYILHTEVEGEILIANMAMVLLLVAVVPLLSELSSVVKSMLSPSDVDLKTTVVEFNKMVAGNPNLRDVATFIANRLNFEYVGLVLNGQIYGSDFLYEPDQLVAALHKLPPPARGKVWQDFTADPELKQLFHDHRLTAVAELKNAHGQAFGYILIGMPLGKEKLDKSDLYVSENTLNVVGAIIDSKLHLRIGYDH